MYSVNTDKYDNAILYFLLRAGENGLHHSRLFALLYLLDREHVRQHDAPVTGDEYVKRPTGPVPSAADNVLARMLGENAIEPVGTGRKTL